MRIAIDVSQIVYTGTGVSRYVSHMVESCIRLAPEHEFILFGSSLRQKGALMSYVSSLTNRYKNVRAVVLPFPLSILDILWNKLHILPIQIFLGDIDIFWSSDWIQPPIGKAFGMTTIHDVSFLHYPESFDKKILDVQKRRLFWAKKECRLFLCDSKATKDDVEKLLHLPSSSSVVVYPGSIT